MYCTCAHLTNTILPQVFFSLISVFLLFSVHSVKKEAFVYTRLTNISTVDLRLSNVRLRKLSFLY